MIDESCQDRGCRSRKRRWAVPWSGAPGGLDFRSEREDRGAVLPWSWL